MVSIIQDYINSMLGEIKQLAKLFIWVFDNESFIILSWGLKQSEQQRPRCVWSSAMQWLPWQYWDA